MRTVEVLARLYPWSVEADDDLRRALAYLDTENAISVTQRGSGGTQEGNGVTQRGSGGTQEGNGETQRGSGVAEDAETLIRAGYGATGVVTALWLLLMVVLPRQFRLPATVGLLGLSLGVVHATRRGPVWLATARRTAALGTAPALVARAVLRTRVEPASERAAAFAADADGALADSLAEHVRQAAGTPRSGLATFGSAWADWNPPLRRAVLLVEAAADAPASERDRNLDRAMTAILDGTRDRMADFAEEVRGPTTAVYAFGVLLPLALVAVLPAAGVAGVPISVPALVVVYDLLLPAMLVGAGAWLLARRPAAFPPPEVPRAHPDVPSRRWPTAVAGGLAGVVALVVTLPLPGWTRWPALVGSMLGGMLVWWFRPVKAVREEARDAEANLSDALYLVGRRVQDGAAVETAIAEAAPEVAGRTGEVLADAAGVQRRLRIGVREAFLGEYGALADVPSSQARSVAALLALAAREGKPAGRAIVSMAEHVEDLGRVEREARRELASVTGTLENTARVFGPLVGGATVAMADGMATGTLGDPLPTAALGLAVGSYVLVLAVILAALSTGLARGFDRALVGYRVGVALLSAVGSFLVGFVGAGLAA